jgi:thymidylate kinase
MNSFIVCEGLDRSGKTTSIKHALSYFENEGYHPIYSKGLKTDTPAGRLSKIVPCTLTLLIEQLYLDKTIIMPELKKGAIILQDRWFYSVLSYNPENNTDKLLERIFVPYLSKPDLLVYFDVSLEQRIKRLENDRTEDHLALLENPQLIEQRKKLILEYYNSFPGNKAIIDTTTLSEEECGYNLYSLIKYSLLKN